MATRKKAEDVSSEAKLEGIAMWMDAENQAVMDALNKAEVSYILLHKCVIINLTPVDGYFSIFHDLFTRSKVQRQRHQGTLKSPALKSPGASEMHLAFQLGP